MQQIPHSGKWLLLAAAAALLVHTVTSALAVAALHVPVTTEIDSEEYVLTTDNTMKGNGFSLEREPPFRPAAERTPGHLLFDIPIRACSFGSDVCAVVISKIVLIGTALLLIAIGQLLSSARVGIVAAIILFFVPSVLYYSLLPYSTEIHYLFYSTLLCYGALLYGVHGNRWGLLAAGLASALAMLLRPAAMFTLIAYFGTAVLLLVLVHGAVRRRLTAVAAVVAVGGLAAYGGWCLRNAAVFGAFQFSTCGGSHVLKYSAREMMPYLDDAGKQEVQAALDANPTFLQRYSGADQFEIADEQGRAGRRLIVVHPLAFLESHLLGSLSSFVWFDPRAIRERSVLAAVAASAIQAAVTLLGFIGLWRLWRRWSPAQRSIIVPMLAFGVVSVLTGGALFSPRFRLPLEPVLAVGAGMVLTGWLVRCLQRRRRPLANRPTLLLPSEAAGKVEDRRVTVAGQIVD